MASGAVMLVMSAAAMTACSNDGGLTSKPLPPVTPDPDDPDPEDPENPDAFVLRIVDPDATAETKALLANLWKIQDEKKFMFGHHDDLWYGRDWEYTEGGSDTKAVCGDYPAVYSLDFAEMTDNRANLNSKANQARLRTMKEAWARGEVITACIHINNPNGGDSWDNNAATTPWPGIITPGDPLHTKFLGWLDNLAAMANDLKDDDGTLIPVLFRPFHEHTQSWSWWGTSRSNETQFIELWKMTIKYLRDTKGVHNFLYAISPQMDSNYGTGTRARLLTRWPGDEWVDFIGMDCYHGSNYNAFTSNLTAIDALSQEKTKPCGVTETGQEAFTAANYWSNGVVAPFSGKKVGMVVMWRNKYVGDVNSSDTHYFSVYPGHPSEDDFRAMHALPEAIFSSKLRRMYQMPTGYAVKGH